MVYPYRSKTNWFWAGAGIGLVLLVSGCSFSSGRAADKILEINGHRIQAEVADTSSERYQGLSGRESLCDNCGMWFVFPDAQKRTFVMRDMNFSLDILWIRDKEIVAVEKDLPPDGKKYTSPPRIDAVLEVNGGFCEKHNIQAGKKIKIIN